MQFPTLDENGTPVVKLPDCPFCGRDELGVIHADFLMCYCCGWEMWKDCEPKRPLRVEEITRCP